MKKVMVMRQGLLKSVDLAFVLQSYVVASVLSTSGVDVLLLLTVFFMLLTLTGWVLNTPQQR